MNDPIGLPDSIIAHLRFVAAQYPRAIRRGAVGKYLHVRRKRSGADAARASLVRYSARSPLP